MSRPIVIPFQSWGVADDARPTEIAAELLAEVPWVSVRDARKECFMAMSPTRYTYGAPPHDLMYESIGYHPIVLAIQSIINLDFDSNYNVCFLNRYDDERNQLGWHSDDSPGMDLDHEIAVVSFGEPRELWVREKGATGVVPQEDRFLMPSGSLLIMPKGYQKTHQHRIPKGSRRMGPRVSLTYRHYIPVTP